MKMTADFYVGTGQELEWIGSLLENGDVYNIPAEILLQINQTMFEEMTFDHLRANNGIIANRKRNWPHQWLDSSLTEYVYIFDTAHEEIYMYQSGVEYLVNPIKIIQGWSLTESNILIATPKFPLMKKDQLIRMEVIPSYYGRSTPSII